MSVKHRLTIVVLRSNIDSNVIAVRLNIAIFLVVLEGKEDIFIKPIAAVSNFMYLAAYPPSPFPEREDSLTLALVAFQHVP